MRRSEDNMRELVLTFYHLGPGNEPRSLGLTTSTFNHRTILLTFFFLLRNVLFERSPEYNFSSYFLTRHVIVVKSV